ncbi:DUF4062 domain-containing protein [Microbacterium sp. SS28]|uniref:ATP-binding protein n=1 Tax=Microbacterium sp. SS28 TaxID=2919948 RepID=UPI001FA96345|nr:DUF4062 domain-containing protein [Microbacterium sp. SS28]
MAPGPAAIRTPDQHLRVFVSSTLKELEPERRAARTAIESMRFAPVMFELGARPHPPRELYRSYLAQSDVFVGIYWESYGWTAPDETVSGLEDEYRLSDDLPRLIYIKQPAPQREDRLEALLDRIRADDRASYKSFADAGELERLIADDLATLLAERFDSTRDAQPLAAPSPNGGGRRGGDIPAPYTAIVGRESEQREVRALLGERGVRLVTLVGPGGIGKSRLAIEIAGALAAEGRDVAFTLLEAVPAPERVIVAVARALGVRDAAAEGSLEDRVAVAVADRDVLLVVDNMEHVLAAADLLVRLLTVAPKLQLLVTSRSPLRVRAEHVYDVGPLTLPQDDAPDAAASAVLLFEQRAAAVRPGFRVTPENAATVTAICRAVDGVPLAIELAAARVRSLSVEQILPRLDSALTLLVGGARDLPERQRALRSTIEWSVHLLEPDARAALGILSVFIGSFSLDSAERVLAQAGVEDPITALEALVDASLLGTTDRRGVTMFRLLALVRAYAAGLLSEEASAAAVEAWLANYRDLALTAQPGLRGSAQLIWLDRLDGEIENLARVTRVLLGRRDLDDAASYVWSLYLFLWIGGYLGVVRVWSEELLDIAERDGVPIGPRTRAIATYYRDAVRFWQEPGYDVTAGLRLSRDLFREAGDQRGAAIAGISLGLALLTGPTPDVPAAVVELDASRDEFADLGDAWGQAMALNVRGRVDMGRGEMAQARARFEESLARATSQGERLGIVIAMNSRGWTRLLTGDVAGAHDDFAHSLDLSLALHHDEGIAYGLEAFAGLRAVEGDVVSAGRLLGAARQLRRRKGFLNPGSFEFYMISLGGLRAAGKGDALDAATLEGLDLPMTEVLELVRH